MSTTTPTFVGAPIRYNDITKPTQPILRDMYHDLATNKILVFNGSWWADVDTDEPQGPTVEELCEQHPGLKELKDKMDEATEKFNAYKALVQENK
jgi:hypothetical protein